MSKTERKQHGSTIAGDLRLAGAYLADDAKTLFNSLTVGGRWTDERDKREFDELNRLSKRLRGLAKAFKTER